MDMRDHRAGDALVAEREAQSDRAFPAIRRARPAEHRSDALPFHAVGQRGRVGAQSAAGSRIARTFRNPDARRDCTRRQRSALASRAALTRRRY